jgi:hypothetical protein
MRVGVWGEEEEDEEDVGADGEPLEIRRNGADKGQGIDDGREVGGAEKDVL